MAVSVDVVGSYQGPSTTVTSYNYTGITVSSGLVNSALLLLVQFGTGSSPVSPSMVWDSGGTNQTMSWIGTTVASQTRFYTFGLLNPVPGTKTLAMSWTNSDTMGVQAVSFQGVDQSAVTSAFKNQSPATFSSITNPSANATCSQPGESMCFGGCVAGGTTFSSSAAGTVITHNQAAIVGSTANVDFSVIVPGASPQTFAWGLAASANGNTMVLEINWDGTTGAAGERNLLTPRLARAGMPRTLGGQARMFPFALPITAAPPPAVGGTLPMMGVG